MTLINFDKEAETSLVSYGGALGKKSVLFDGKYYMLKFPKKFSGETDYDKTFYTNNPIAEDLGCKIFKSLGIPTQSTFLGTSEGKLVVACEDFLRNDYGNNDVQLQEFSSYFNSYFKDSKDSKNDLRSGEFSLEDLNLFFDKYPFLGNIRKEAKERFWEMFIVDDLIVNNDRHAGNWGYFANIKTNKIEKVAPIYDCGSSLAANMKEDDISDIVRNEREELFREAVYNKPLGKMKVGGVKVSPTQYIRGLSNPDLNEVLLSFFPKMKEDSILKIIGDYEHISDNRKIYLQSIIRGKFAKVLEPAHKKLNKLLR
jgi:hypothetical protein